MPNAEQPGAAVPGSPDQELVVLGRGVEVAGIVLVDPDARVHRVRMAGPADRDADDPVVEADVRRIRLDPQEAGAGGAGLPIAGGGHVPGPIDRRIDVETD